jgi:hypothetical protein
MIVELGILAAAMLGPAHATTATHPAHVIPTVYEAGHFYADPKTIEGQKLRLVVDTGGGGGAGMYWITKSAARRLGLKVRTCKVGDASISVASVPDYKPGEGLPPPLESRSPCGNTLIVGPKHYSDGDGQLGAGYLPGRVWTFNYPDRRFIVEGSSWQPNPRAHATKLGFMRSAKGEIATGFARVAIVVAGHTINMLLDTGATAHPTKAGKEASEIPTVNGEGVTSYIVHSIFERWHKQHPAWRVIKNGDDLLGPKHQTRIIEVPKVQIAGWTVGPVWFTERPDANFHKFMGQWMDKKPDGAVGGNVFRHFVMTIDYPDAVAYFRCVRGCIAAETTDN